LLILKGGLVQIEADQSYCPVCKAARLEGYPVLHHMICAFIGPSYDFVEKGAGYICPKCRRKIVSGDGTCEIVGASARCANCFSEMLVSPAAEASGSRDCQ